VKLKKITIEHFRSIEKVEIDFPDGKPVVLFGPNNVGKSNILRGLECILGEKFASYIDFQDSDFFKREKGNYKSILFKAEFDENIKSRYPEASTICFSTNHEFKHYKTQETLIENTYHYESGDQMFLSNEEREKCHFILIDASRDISRQFSYSSQYNMLSKMAKKMHGALLSSTKDKLDDHFKNIKDIFESVPEYKIFYNKLQSSFESNVNGFEHKLDIDLTAYDPNNYFNSLRIIARDGKNIRSFDEFGTGEQQILLMSFMKAYAETFKGENFILGIEEPEAHLHPLAQRWLAKNINSMARSGLQVIITTHSPEFLDIENLEGLVKVYKESDTTKVIQNDAEKLAEKCVSLKANAGKTTKDNILAFYKSNSFYDQLKGFFAKKIILVEGPTEYFSLSNYFENCGYDLIKNGVEIIDCKGKSQIARNYRLFASYNYSCFCLFDADGSNDEKTRGNVELGEIFDFDHNIMNCNPGDFTCDNVKKFGYFGKDFESYMRNSFSQYAGLESTIGEGPKPLKAKIISEDSNFEPSFVNLIAESLELEENGKIDNDGLRMYDFNEEIPTIDLDEEEIPTINLDDDIPEIKLEDVPF
jgi:putative ATP-dependent endonuclease of the OLD family